jgi:hypothetical protein
MLEGLKLAVSELTIVGCRRIWLDGGFITKKRAPKDYDCCYERNGMNEALFKSLYPILASPARNDLQKIKYKGEFYAADDTSFLGITILELFQLVTRVSRSDIAKLDNKKLENLVNKLRDKKKGIIELDLGALK